MIEYEANLVCRKMNEAGRKRVPFLFGVDFEMTKGFFFESPMEQIVCFFLWKDILITLKLSRIALFFPC